MAEAAVEPIGWERALMAAEKVKERLRRATRALDTAGVPYAVAGGNAVAEGVGRGGAGDALEAAGFVYHTPLDIDLFIAGPQGKPSGGVHILFAGEKVRPDDEHPL